jgi:hypothetical protein
MLHDMWHAQGWEIISHGGFVTYVHHNASGFATYIYPRSAAKLWGIVCIRSKHLPQNHADLFIEYDKLLEET